jgi:hypothetical protein
MDIDFWVNKGNRAFVLDIASAMDKHASKRGGIHVVDCAWFSGQKGAQWTNFPVSIYYAPVRPTDCKFENRYFGLNFNRNSGGVTIFDADRIEEIRFVGLRVVATGEFVFSRWRHDFRNAQTGHFAVDGGLDYFRAVGSFEGTRRATFGVRDGRFVEIT